VPEEDKRKKDAEAAPEDDLLGEGDTNKAIESEETRDRRDGGDTIIDIDRPDEVSLLPFKREVTGEAVGVHREGASKEGRDTTPGASQAQASAENPSDAMETHHCHTF
jgi:hypothetical protein